MIGVERVDYVRVPVTDIEEAKRFYGDVLGLPLSPNSPADDWLEYEKRSTRKRAIPPTTAISTAR